MELELRHLRVLCTVAENGSLTRAAAALRMSQPSLTAQLQRIERMLGGQLFERHSGGVVPTPLGEHMLTRARAVLPTVEDLMRHAAVVAGRTPEAELVRIGSVGAPLIGGVIAGLRSIFPGCRVTSMWEDSPVAMVDHLAAGRLELAVVGDSPGYELTPSAGMEFRTVATVPVFVLLPERHRLAGQADVDLAELREDDWALPEPDDDRTREYWATVAGYRMRVPYEATGKLMVELVRAGHAVSLCQPTFDQVPGVAVRPIVGDPLWYRHILAWHSGGRLAVHGDTLVKHAADVLACAVHRNPAYLEWSNRGT